MELLEEEDIFFHKLFHNNNLQNKLYLYSIPEPDTLSDHHFLERFTTFVRVQKVQKRSLNMWSESIIHLGHTYSTDVGQNGVNAWMMFLFNSNENHSVVMKNMRNECTSFAKYFTWIK